MEEGYGRKADIWSLGATLLELLTGEAAWAGYNPMAAVYALAEEGRIPDLPSNVSPECTAFLTLCFTRDPELRPHALDLLKHPWLTQI